MPTPLEIVVVGGAGALGRHHTRILAGLEGVQLLAVADPHEEAGRAKAAEFHTRWVPDYREVIDHAHAASIVVPTTLHQRVAADFLDRRIPVMVEKPLAANVADAWSIVQLAEARDTLLQVGHVERFNPALQAACHAAGEPKYVRCERVAPFTFRSTDISVIHDLMIHDVDLLLDLVGSRVASVEAFGVTLASEHPDCVQARLRFENGCLADLTASRINPQPRRSMIVWSDAGTVHADLMTRQVTRYAPTPALQFGPTPVELAARPDADVDALKADFFGRFLTSEAIPVPEADALTAELTQFVDCVRTGAKPTVGGRQALAAMEVAQRITDAVHTHQWDATPTGRTGPQALFPHPTTTTRRAG